MTQTIYNKTTLLDPNGSTGHRLSRVKLMRIPQRTLVDVIYGGFKGKDVIEWAEIKLPDDYEVLAMWVDERTRVVECMLYSSTFDPVEPGTVPPYFDAEVMWRQGVLATQAEIAARPKIEITDVGNDEIVGRLHTSPRRFTAEESDLPTEVDGEGD